MVYCDGSFTNDPHQAADGVIIMNTERQVCDGRADRFSSSSPIASEAKALLEATTYACNSPLYYTIFFDCLKIVNCLKRPEAQMALGVLWTHWSYRGATKNRPVHLDTLHYKKR
ncbi:hypothetical protein LINPERHAP2_LOCUS33809 [Linum perenne]